MLYTVVILREREGRCSALVPALEGCATWGETLPEALRMVEEAIRAYRDGLYALGRTMPPDVAVISFALGDAREAYIYKVSVLAEDATG